MRAGGTATYVGALTLAWASSTVACYSSSSSGGEPRFDAAPAIAPPFEGDSGSGSTWVDLHRDFFGPTGRASCAGDGTCHGAPDQPGARASAYVCAPGRDGCYAGITKLVVPGDTTTPAIASKTTLHIVLRKSDGTGFMPKRPEFVFSSADMDRVDAWIHRGAPNDGPTDAPDGGPSDAANDTTGILDASSDASSVD